MTTLLTKPSIDRAEYYAWQSLDFTIPVVLLGVADGSTARKFLRASSLDVILDFGQTLPVAEQISVQFWFAGHCTSVHDCESHAAFAEVCVW